MNKPKDCANLAKEYNGETNWCLLRDAHCHMIVKHERYKFDKADLHCDYLDGLNVGIQEVMNTFRNCDECGKRFKGTGRAKYCGDVCKKIAKRKSTIESNQRRSRVENS
jgi:hypothetical protein